MSANIIRGASCETGFRRENPDEVELLEVLLYDALYELRHLRGELRAMSQTQQEQTAQLTSDVAALTTAFTDFETAVAAEIASIKSSPAAADPVVAQALTNIEALTAKIKADTAAATPAPATPPAAPAVTAATGDGTIPTITG